MSTTNTGHSNSFEAFIDQTIELPQCDEPLLDTLCLSYF
jgi:hypothetical protein